MNTTGKYLNATDALAGLRDDLLSGRRPTRWPLGTGGFARVEFGPGSVLLLGGAPNAGKTALAGQLLFDAMRLNEDLRAVVANVEMSAAALLERQLARISGISLTTLRERQTTLAEAESLERGLATLEPLCERLVFLRPPFSVDNLAKAADDIEADVLLCDYIQRFQQPGDSGDPRRATGALMSKLRQAADVGLGVLVVSAVGRSRDAKGRASYSEGLGLASFRETSELEYGADDAYILTEGEAPNERVLLHLKCRHGELKDLALRFDGRLQRFAVSEQVPPEPGKVANALAALWASTPAADVDDE